MARAAGVAGLLALLAITACGGAEDATGDLTAVGPHATAASTRIVYADDAPPLGIGYEAFRAGWDELARRVEGIAELREVSRADGEVSYVAETESSGIALDLVVEGGLIQVAQLALVDGVGDEDDPHVYAAIEGFLDLVGAGFDADRLGVGDLDPLFSEREMTAEGVGVTVYLASNEDSILVGAVGAT